MATTTSTDSAVVSRLMAEQDITEHALAIRSGVALSTLRRRMAGAGFTAAELRAVATVLGTSAAAIIAAADQDAA